MLVDILQLSDAKADASEAARVAADVLAKHKSTSAAKLQGKEQELTATKDAAANEKQRLESEMQQLKVAAAASEAALQKRMEGEMAEQKAAAEALLAKTVREWQLKVCHGEIFVSSVLMTTC